MSIVYIIIIIFVYKYHLGLFYESENSGGLQKYLLRNQVAGNVGNGRLT